MATVAAYDVEGHKSEPVNLELIGPGLGSREWMEKAPHCPKVAHTPAAPTPAQGRRWPAAIAIVASAACLAWVLYVLAWPRKRWL